ncbi:MAG: AAA family ATPase [Betaproteobacteria bacterium]|nr:AAA family ATPase [Betaproteobacteria bacterium]
MRIARLDLSRFGPFTDRTLTLPKAEVDLHLIVGRNEAGKSSLRQAVVDLLYGIPVRTQYDFKHLISDLLLGGVLENGGESLEFQRFKRSKNPLVNVAGDFFSEQELGKLLGGTDREFFERNFGLDYLSLVTGAKEILNSSSDFGQMLFQAAAGLSGVHKGPHRAGTGSPRPVGPRVRDAAAYYSARKQFAEAEATLKQVAVSSQKWLTAKRILEAATTEAEKAHTAYRDIETGRERLERIRRVTPALQKLRSAIAERERLGRPALLPKDPEKTLTDAEADIASAQAKEGLLAPRMAQDTAALAAIVLAGPYRPQSRHRQPWQPRRGFPNGVGRPAEGERRGRCEGRHGSGQRQGHRLDRNRHRCDCRLVAQPFGPRRDRDADPEPGNA